MSQEEVERLEWETVCKEISSICITCVSDMLNTKSINTP